ncbi:MAG: hypothetical protein NWE84_01220 [Candidatus Bathyarchaeota archaeon]|nr:hypothetical protein [Candidatus Bathyarchaeota archaeon]
MASEAREPSKTIITFKVMSDIISINETEYKIARGNGEVIGEKHYFPLQAQGTNPDGQSITLKLAGRYFQICGTPLCN